MRAGRIKEANSLSQRIGKDITNRNNLRLSHWPLAAASSCVTDFFRDVFVEWKTFAVRSYGSLS